MNICTDHNSLLISFVKLKNQLTFIAKTIQVFTTFIFIISELDQELLGKAW